MIIGYVCVLSRRLEDGLVPVDSFPGGVHIVERRTDPLVTGLKN